MGDFRIIGGNAGRVWFLLIVASVVLVTGGCAGLVTGSSSPSPSGNPLSISGVSVSSVTLTSAAISWQTNTSANSQVEYGTSTSYGSLTALDSAMVTGHQQTVSNLKGGITYHFRVHSTDASNTAAVSGDMTFITAADTIPPTVSLTSPANGAAVSGTVSVMATATDNVAVASVQFQLDGANVGAAVTAAPYSYSWDTTKTSNGAHTLRAVATDTSNNSATSAGVAVTVGNAAADTTPPVVSMTAPANNASVTGSITLSATATDVDSAVSFVQFQVDGVNSGAPVTVAPYTVSLDTTRISNGSHQLTALAKDPAGNQGVSAGVGITVNNASPVPNIVSLSPASGVVGTSVTISGANFGSTQGSSTVKFNGVAATPTTWSAASIVAPVPSGAATGNVVVTVGGVASNGFVFTLITPAGVPTGLAATAVSSSQISLTWTASTGSVAGYRIYRGGTQIGTSTNTSFQDGGLNASTQYTYTVAAFDPAGNLSAQSAAASATTLAASGGGIPSTLGWFQIPNTAYQAVCPNPAQYPGINGTEGCAAVVNDWSGGFSDTTRNRLVWWGGGHAGYYGNEIYYLDLPSLSLGRYTNPVQGVTGSASCTAVNPLDNLNWNGTPNSFHNYQGQVYVPSIDAMFFTMGDMSRATNSCPITTLNGNLANAWPTWLFKFGELPSQQPASGTCCWHPQDPEFGGPLTFSGGKGWARDYTVGSYVGEYASTAYDPVSQLVYVYDRYSLYTWNPLTNVGTLLGKNGTLNTTGNGAVVSAIDPVHRIFVILGGGVAIKFDMTTNTATNVSTQTSGCSAIQGGVGVGLDFDSKQGLLVGWAGGDTVYLFNAGSTPVSTQYGTVAALACLPVTYANGPGAPAPNGTNGRFRYFPALGVFAVVNANNRNAYTLRLTNSGGTGAPLISAVTTTSITTTSATITWNTDVPSTSMVEYGATTSYGSATTLDTTLVTAHSQALSGLTTNAVYHYRVHSKNAGGVEAISADSVFSTGTGGDTTPPTVSITSPAAGSTLTGSVTVTANATDNVGVTGVQFMLDGANLGAKVLSSPWSTSWDTTGAANGAHVLSAAANDAAGNVGTAVGVSVTVSNTTTSGPAVPFQQRCAAPGVIKCEGFDDTSGLIPLQTIYPSFADNQYHWSLDTTIKSAGASSLHFNIPAQIAQDTSGHYNAPLGGAFGPPESSAPNGNTFYVQFRERMDAAFVALKTDGEGWKQFGVHGGTTTCQNVGIVIQNIFWRGFPQGFTNCGGIGLTQGTGSTALLEQGDYNCLYSNQTPANCAYYQADQWMTFYFKIVLNHWDPTGTAIGQGSNTILGWMAFEGQPLKQIFNLTNFPLSFQVGPTDVYDQVTLFVYDSRRTATLAYPVANVWYDDLIVSTKPIPAPDGTTPPQ